jgi:hypothetical protein
MLTRKDYKAIAEGIKRATTSDNPKTCSKYVVVELIAQYMARDNGRFDIEKFRQACE